MQLVKKTLLCSTISVSYVLTISNATAQWVNFQNQTTTRMPTGVGQNTASLSTTDNQEKDYAWGDVNKDGWIDLVCVRKSPFTSVGGRPNVLFMNENGVLIDRTAQYASAAINVPPQQGLSQGFLDSTNDRDVILVDVNNDGWLDIVTATTLSETHNPPDPPVAWARYLGHPRIYINLGNDANGNWLGFVYDYNRIPQLLSKPNHSLPANPRFCSITAGDLTGNGYVDLYFGDYDNGELNNPPKIESWDMDNKLLINLGPANPGHFIDESNLRTTFQMQQTAFGAASIICDITGNGAKDILKQTSLQSPQHVAAIINNPANLGNFLGYQEFYSSAPYFVSAGDLNNDGRLDLFISDDSTDRYLINTTTPGSTVLTFSQSTISSAIGTEFGFGSNSVFVDLNNNGFQDVLVADVDVDSVGCNRRTYIYRNQGQLPTPTLREDSPSVIATGSLTGTHDIGAFDIDNDGWVDLVLGRCTGTQVWMNLPPASASFMFPNGRPTMLSPDAPTTFEIQLTPTGTGTPTIVANTGRMYVSTNGGSFATVAMSHQGNNVYQATIPAKSCPDSVRYYFSVQVQSGVTTTTVLHPSPLPGASVPEYYYSATTGYVTHIAFSDDFEGAATGWTVSNHPSLTKGAWEVAIPNGTWNEGVRAAPHEDNTPGGTRCYVTGNAAPGAAVSTNSVAGGPTQLISPVLDLGGENATISFAYWMYTSIGGGTNGATAPKLDVHVSNNDGASWTLVKSLAGPRPADPNLTPAEDNSWKDFSFVVGDHITPTSQVRVRFSVSRSSPFAAGIVEAAIDDFVVSKPSCVTVPPPCPGDIAPPGGDNQIGVPDLLKVISSWGACPAKGDCSADVAPPGGDGAVGVPDLLFIISRWGPC